MKKYLRNLKRRLIVNRQGKAANIFLFATRRGGSTFLAEVLASEPGIWFANEPLGCFEALSGYKERIKWLPLLPDSQFFDLLPNQERQLQEYINNLLVGGCPLLGSSSRPKFPLIADRVLLKILNAPFLIDWFCNIKNSQVLFLSRHPAAQTLSVLRNKWPMSAYTYFAKPKFLSHYFTPEKIEFGQRILAEGTDWEKGILNWIMDTYVPLYLSSEKILRITYEELTLIPETVLEFLCKFLNLKDYKSICSRIKKPSGSSHLSTESTRRLITQGTRFGLISQWQTQISQEQASQAQIILERFEIDIYSMQDPLPNSKYLIASNIKQFSG